MMPDMIARPAKFCGTHALCSAQGLSSYVGEPLGRSHTGSAPSPLADGKPRGRGRRRVALLILGNPGNECHDFNAAMESC